MDTDEHRWGRISRDMGVPPMLDAPRVPGKFCRLRVWQSLRTQHGRDARVTLVLCSSFYR
jgi:hypothetical protein